MGDRITEEDHSFLVLLDLVHPGGAAGLPDFLEPVLSADRASTGESVVGRGNLDSQRRKILGSLSCEGGSIKQTGQQGHEGKQ